MAGQVPANYDSLLGKLIVWAETREEAIIRMKRALGECIISGVPTTIPYHLLIMDVEEFKQGIVDTGFIIKHAEKLVEPIQDLPQEVRPRYKRVTLPQNCIHFNR